MSKKQEVAKQEVAKQEVAKQTTSDVATQHLAEWGQEAVSLKDFVIPKVLIMQPMSEMVTQGDGKIGEFRVNSSGRVLGDIDTGLVFIPFKVQKLWYVFKQGKKGMEFHSVEAITPENENADWDYLDADEVKCRRDYTLNFFCLLADDLKQGDAVLPHVLSFRRTGTKAGKQLYTQMYFQNRAAGLSPAAYAMKLSGKKTTNDLGTFVMPTVSVERRATEAEINAALSWYKTFNTASVVVDNTDVHKEKDAAFGDDEF